MSCRNGPNDPRREKHPRKIKHPHFSVHSQSVDESLSTNPVAARLNDYPFALRAAGQDPLPSWNYGSVKQAIVKFVDDVTRQGGSSFVPTDQRIAVFHNNGTL
jgi:hypothetical protein